MNEVATLRTYYEERLRAVEAIVQKQDGNISEEAIHKLRVEIKKIKAVAQLVHFCTNDFQRKQLLKAYKKIFKAAGAIREVQLECKALEKLNMLDALSRYASHLKEHLENAMHHYLMLIDAPLVQTLEATRGLIVPCFDAVHEEDVNRFLKVKSSKIDALAGNGRLGKRQTHKLRKVLKVFYYIILLFHGKDEHFKNIDAFQELLGRWHDAIVLARYLQRATTAGSVHTKERIQIAVVKHKMAVKSKRLFKKIQEQIPGFQQAKQSLLSQFIQTTPAPKPGI